MKLVIIDKTNCARTDIEKQTCSAPACQSRQLVQTVECLWVTTYSINLIIYFCPKVLFPRLKLPEQLLLSDDGSAKTSQKGYKEVLNQVMRDFCPKSKLLFFCFQGIAGKSGPRGQRGPTVGNSSVCQLSPSSPHK